MYSETVNETVRREVEPILKSLGFSLVELTVARRKGSTRIGVVIHGPSGVGIEECSQVSRLLFPRLETVEDLPDVSLEVSSPGMDRTLKSAGEYGIFTGRGIRILMEGETEWRGGTLVKFLDGMIDLIAEGKTETIPVQSIRKARLDSRWDSKAKGSKEEDHAV